MAHKMVHSGLAYEPIRPGEPLSDERHLVLERVGSGKSVLEVGASSGYFSGFLRRQGCTVTAVEINPAAAHKARQEGQHVIAGDIEDEEVLRTITESFDVILCMHVLEHLVDPWRVLRELRSVLKPAGALFVLLPNVAGWRMRKALFFNGAFDYTDVGILDKTHLRFLTLETGRALLETTGYEIVDWVPTDVCIPLERRMSRLPVLRRATSMWRRWMLDRYPNLCTEIVFFQAVKGNGSA